MGDEVTDVSAPAIPPALQRAKYEAEIRKLEEETRALNKSEFRNPTTWLAILTAIVGLSAAVGQFFVSGQDVKIAQANNEAADAKKDKLALETQINLGKKEESDRALQQSKAELEQVTKDRQKAEGDLADYRKGLEDYQQSAQAQFAIIKKRNDELNTQLDEKQKGLAAMRQFIPPSTANVALVRGLDEQQKGLSASIEKSQAVTNSIEQAAVVLKPAQWAYYGDLDPKTHGWKFLNFVRNATGAREIPSKDDVVTATTEVNARKGPIQHVGEQWIEQPVVGYVRYNERVKVVEVKQPPADLSDQDHSVWIRFERVPK